MSISKDELLQRRTDILADYEKAKKEIEKGEAQIKTMKNNLNALGGAVQQVEMFIKQIEEKGDEMPPEKQQALDIATS
jgi:predicted  nucleic acid-binding Zn-ribbon protein